MDHSHVHWASSLSQSLHLICTEFLLTLLWAGLAKSLARRPGAIVFSSRAIKMYHRPARRATLNTGLPRNVPSKGL